MELLVYLSQGQDIGNAIRVVLYHSVSTEITHEVCPGSPHITVDVHPTIRFMNVFEKAMITEYRDSGLAVKQDPFFWDMPSMTSLQCSICQKEKLAGGILIFLLIIHSASHQ